MNLKHSGTNVLVFDVGGSHASAALAQDADLEGGCSSELDNGAPAESILGSLESLGKRVLAENSLENGALSGVSLGFPNPFNYVDGISYMRHKYGELYGYNLRVALANRFGLPPQAIAFVNDASACLLGEIHFGAAACLDRVVGITLGTGVGSAFAISGQIVTTGDVPNGGFLWNAPFQGGIVEDFVSTRGIRRVFKGLGGADISVSEIATHATTDHIARTTMQQFGAILGKALKSTCSAFHPDAIVLGGAISRSAHLFLPKAQAQLNGTGTQLIVSKLFDNATLLGAAFEWHRMATPASDKTKN